VGLVQDTRCKIYSAQAAGCAPIINALHKGTDMISPVSPTRLRVRSRWQSGRWLLRRSRRQKVGGWGESVTDEEIIEGIKLLARTERIFTGPAGGTEVAVTRKLIQKGRIPRDDSIVISITGNGYKTLEAVARQRRAALHD
jgi:threonine synthase